MTGKQRRRWRCPCDKIRGLLGSVYGQIGAVLVVLFGALAVLVAVTDARPRVALWVGLGAALILGLVAVWLLVRPLRTLMRSMNEVREGGYRHLPPPTPPPASAEVVGLERACREMTDRVSREASASSEAHTRMQATLVRISKELQDPLVAVQGELLRLSGREGPLSGHARQALLDAALHNAEVAVRLVAEAGELARLHAPDTRPRAEAFALDTLAQGVVQRLRAQAARLGVDLEVRAPSDLPLVSADHRLVDEGVTRLVDHALRRCPAGARVRVTLQSGPDGVRTQVRGIEADLASEAVAAFPGAPPSTRTSASSGEGLGVAIARRVAELHGTELSVTVAPGLHASYAFSLPRADLPPERRPAAHRT